MIAKAAERDDDEVVVVVEAEANAARAIATPTLLFGNR